MTKPSVFDELANMAKELVDGGRLEEAELAYRRVLAAHPSHEPSLLGLVRIRSLRGNPAFGDADFRYMLDGGERGLVEGLFEYKDAWGLGGALYISKTRPAFSNQGHVLPLRPGSRFHKQRFELDTGAKGWAIVFETSDTTSILAGWVHLDRESDVTQWIGVLNDQIKQRLEENKIAIDPDEHARRSIAFFRSLGVPIPEASTMDELMTKLEAASVADEPLRAPRTLPDDDDSA